MSNNMSQKMLLRHTTLRSTHIARRPATRMPVCSSTTTATPIVETGAHTRQGTSRKRNEDKFFLDAQASVLPGPFLAVYDGHGGDACSDWLTNKLPDFIVNNWQPSMPEASITKAFIAADKRILTPQGGFLGLGERGIGGSKCGSTATTVLLYKDADGKQKLLAANVGDARTVLVRGKKAVQLSQDHVPDREEERDRIEAQNPNGKLPLVRYIGGCWRVGGLLALSRAFGDAYLKGTSAFEGIQAGSDGYSSGFGVIAEPYCEIIDITPEDSFLVLSSDGLYANEERGGGSGLTIDDVAAMCLKMSKKSCEEIASALAQKAVESGSTDDVTVIVAKLNA